jgi:hypothetical protein
MEICRHARGKPRVSPRDRLAYLGHQLAPRHEESSSGSNDPIGDLEAQVEQLRTELRHRNMVWIEDGQCMNELNLTSGFCKTSLLNGIWQSIGCQFTFHCLGPGSQSSCSRGRA